jgi:hypothetical protein
VTVTDALNAVRKLTECNGEDCLGALMVLLTAVRCHTVDAAVAYRGGDTENIRERSMGLMRRF